MTVYYAAFQNISVAAVQDLFELLAPSNAPVEILRIHVSQNTSETSEQLRLEFRVVSGSPTSGSAGGTITPEPADRAVTRAFGGTVERNNTTQLTGGTTELTWSEGFNMLSGFEWRATPEDVIRIAASEYFVVELPTAPASSTPMNGLLVFREG